MDKALTMQEKDMHQISRTHKNLHTGGMSQHWEGREKHWDLLATSGFGGTGPQLQLFWSLNQKDSFQLKACLGSSMTTRLAWATEQGCLRIKEV